MTLVLALLLKPGDQTGQIVRSAAGLLFECSHASYDEGDSIQKCPRLKRQPEWGFASVSNHQTTLQLEIQLLGAPRAYVDGELLDPQPGKRAWELLIVMLLCPLASTQDVEELFGRAVAIKAKSELRKALGGASGFIEDDPHAYRLVDRPQVDYWDSSPDDQEAFDYFVARGDLLPDYAHMPLVEEERKHHYERLCEIVERLVQHRNSKGEIEALLQRARAVLPEGHIAAIRYKRRSSIEVMASYNFAVNLQTLKSHLDYGAVEPSDADRLQEVVDEVERQAQSWRPPRIEDIETVATLVVRLKRLLPCNWDNIYVKVANTFSLVDDVQSATDFFRPWIGEPGASANAFCTAALYDDDLGYLDEAEECFDRALVLSRSADFTLTVREKRNIQLAQLRGGSYQEILLEKEAAVTDLGYEIMSPGSRASIWCNMARAARSPAEALILTQRGREIDKGKENPNYEFSLLSYARAAGEKVLAKEYAGQVAELMQGSRPIGFQYRELTLHAEQLVREFSEPGKQDSLERDARLEEAAEIFGQISAWQSRRFKIPSLCSSLLKQAKIAQALGNFREAYQYASTAYLLGGENRQGRTRYAVEADELRRRLATELTGSETRQANIAAEYEGDLSHRPRALLPPESVQ